MQLPNRRGTTVDPVPFLVAALSGALACLLCGPPYLLALGLPLTPAVGASVAVALVVTALAYHEFVWTATGSDDVERPAGLRLQRIGYAAAIAVAIGAGLLLPVL